MTYAVIEQPTLWPRMHLLHRAAMAAVEVVQTRAQFTRSADHHRVHLPDRLIAVPIRHEGARVTFAEIRCGGDARWGSKFRAWFRTRYPQAPAVVVAHVELVTSMVDVGARFADVAEVSRRAIDEILGGATRRVADVALVSEASSCSIDTRLQRLLVAAGARGLIVGGNGVTALAVESWQCRRYEIRVQSWTLPAELAGNPSSLHVMALPSLYQTVRDTLARARERVADDTRLPPGLAPPVGFGVD